jgi:hypothetical protein
VSDERVVSEPPTRPSTVEETAEYRLATGIGFHLALQRKYVITTFAWNKDLLMYVAIKTDEWRSIPTVVL